MFNQARIQTLQSALATQLNKNQAHQLFMQGFIIGLNQSRSATHLVNQGLSLLEQASAETVAVSVAEQTLGIVAPTGALSRIVNGLISALFKGYRKQGDERPVKPFSQSSTLIKLLSQALGYGVVLHYGDALLDEQAKQAPRAAGLRAAEDLLKGVKRNELPLTESTTLCRHWQILLNYLVREALVYEEPTGAPDTSNFTEGEAQILLTFAAAELLGLSHEYLVEQGQQQSLIKELEALSQQHRTELAALQAQRPRALHRTVMVASGGEVKGNLHAKQIGRAAGTVNINNQTSASAMDNITQALTLDNAQARQARAMDAEVDKESIVVAGGGTVGEDVYFEEIGYQGLIIKAACAVSFNSQQTKATKEDASAEQSQPSERSVAAEGFEGKKESKRSNSVKEGHGAEAQRHQRFANQEITAIAAPVGRDAYVTQIAEAHVVHHSGPLQLMSTSASSLYQQQRRLNPQDQRRKEQIEKAPDKVRYLDPNLPPDNPYFSGRTAVLGRLNTPCRQAYTVLAGLGGVGKTETLVQFAYGSDSAEPPCYPVIVWLESGLEGGDTQDRLYEHYLQWGERLGVLVEDKAAKKLNIQAIQAQAAQLPKVLWLFDDVESYAVIQPFLPNRKPAGHTYLISSRSGANWPGKLFRVESLTSFSPEESLAYLGCELSGLTAVPTTAEQSSLAETLGHFPLALSQASAYLVATKKSIPHYLELFQREDKKRSVLEYSEEGSETRTVLNAWQLSLKSLQESHQMIAIELLHRSAYLASTFINHQDLRPSDLGEVAYEEAIQALQQYSLVTRVRGEGLQVHQLVQKVVRMVLSREEEFSPLISIMKHWVSGAPLAPTLADLARHRETLPHIEALLGYYKQYLTPKGIQEASSAQTKYEETLKIPLLERLSRTYSFLGDTHPRESILKGLLAYYEGQSPRDPETCARVLNSLGNVLYRLGKIAEARDYYSQALSRLESHDGQEGIALADPLHNLGNILFGLGEVTEAKAHYQRSLGLRQQHHGTEFHISCAKTWCNLGRVAEVEARLEEAEGCYTQSLQLYEEAEDYGPEHVELTNSLNGLGSVKLKQKVYDVAKGYCERALRLRQGHYGAEHVKCSNPLLSLAEVMSAIGEYDSAEQYYQQSLALKRAYYGEHHVELRRPLEGLRTLAKTQAVREQVESWLNKVAKEGYSIFSYGKRGLTPGCSAHLYSVSNCPAPVCSTPEDGYSSQREIMLTKSNNVQLQAMVAENKTSNTGHLDD